VQPAAAVCAACGQPAPSQRPILQIETTGPQSVWESLLLTFGAPIATAAIVGGILAGPLGWASLASVGAGMVWLRLRRASRLRPLPQLLLEDGSRCVRGHVRADRAVVCHVERLVDGSEQLLLWQARSARFEVVTATGEAAHIDGVVQVEGADTLPDDATRGRLLAGLTGGVRVGGVPKIMTLRHGDEVELWAAFREQPIPAGYRDVRVVWMACGLPGRPVRVRVARSATAPTGT
jgi:hypothetical protein